MTKLRPPGSGTDKEAAVEDPMLEVLDEEMRYYEQKLNELAERLRDLTGTEFEFGFCRFNPHTDDAEAKVEEVKRCKAEIKRLLGKLAEYEKTT
ncbi:MAG: hypothetical protein H5T74_09880 [Actinobacteria bacterium]|nr:hypothetical protein [Actinomycetota bacterium]